MLFGLYKLVTKSPIAAAFIRFSITFQGVIKSDNEMQQKSCPKGAPNLLPAAKNAEIPGNVSS